MILQLFHQDVTYYRKRYRPWGVEDPLKEILCIEMFACVEYSILLTIYLNITTLTSSKRGETKAEQRRIHVLKNILF